MAERYLYVPSIGLAIALAFVLVWLEARMARVQVTTMSAVMALILGLLTRSRNEAWHSDIALFEAEVAATPSNPEALMDLGGAYSAVGRAKDTLALCSKSRVLPSQGLERLFTACARILEAQGRFGEAEPYFRSGAAGDGPPADYIVYARFLIRLGRLEEAAAQFEKAIGMERDPVRQHSTRAEMLLKLQPERLDEALREIDAALSEDPTYEIAQNLRLRILAAMGRGARRGSEPSPEPGEPVYRRAEAAPALASTPEDGPFGRAATETLARVLGGAPSGSPAWIVARADDPAALARLDALAAIFTRAGWVVRKKEKTPVPARQGVFLYTADDAPPPYVSIVQRALTEAGLAPSYGTAYRAYYDEMVRTKPGFQGFELAPDQTFIVVFGRVK